MSAILKQRNIFVTQEFELADDSLKVRVSRPFSYADNEIKFENITSVITRLKAPNTILSIISIIMFAGIIITVISHFTDSKGSNVDDIIFYIILLSLFIFLLRLTYENKVNLIILNGQSLSFYANSPNKQAVNDYIQQIFIEQKKYLLKRYAQDDPYLSEEQLSANLKWLWERKIINDLELDDLRFTLLSKNSNQKIVGFRFNSSDNDS
jgi:hypothetical protein